MIMPAAELRWLEGRIIRIKQANGETPKDPAKRAELDDARARAQKLRAEIATSQEPAP